MEILFSNKKKQSTNPSYNMDGPWKHVMWKEPVRKHHILYDSIYMKCPE